MDSPTYYDAAISHIEGAGVLHEKQFYALSFYVSGLAVECILRALIARESMEFDEKHDLRKLFKRSRFANLVSSADAGMVEEALTRVTNRWDNTHRFRSANSLRKLLKRAGLDRRIKGDFLKTNSKIVYDAAMKVVKTGAVLWKS